MRAEPLIGQADFTARYNQARDEEYAEVIGRCQRGLLPGDRVLLAAAPAEGTLTAYSLAVVDQAIRARGAFPPAQGGTP